MEEIKLNMENLTEGEREQLLKLVEKANKKESKVWKPNSYDEYYCNDDEGETRRSTWSSPECRSGRKVDENRYTIGNCFKTEEEAKFACERQKLIAELERFAKEHNEGRSDIYLLSYDNYLGQFTFVTDFNNLGNALPRFTSPEIIQAAIEHVGADRLRKYYFGIKE